MHLILVKCETLSEAVIWTNGLACLFLALTESLSSTKHASYPLIATVNSTAVTASKQWILNVGHKW
jgi:hypothetical protein